MSNTTTESVDEHNLNNTISNDLNPDSTSSLDLEAINNNINNNLYTLIDAPKTSRSIVWKHFAFILKDDGTQIKNLVYCRLCKKIRQHSSSSTSNLLSHNCIKKFKRSTSTNVVQLDSESKRECTLVLTKWIVNDCRPFSTIAGTNFQDVAKYFIKVGAKNGNNIDLDHLIPHRTTLSNNVKILRRHVDEALTIEIAENVKYGCGATSDLYTECFSSESYFGLTLSYFIGKKQV
jgi:hypothetical protein